MTAISCLRLAAIGALAISFALTLSACGRRGPLNEPPRAAAQPNPRQPEQQQPQQEQAAAEPGEDEFGNPPVPRGQKKPFPLDGLLN